MLSITSVDFLNLKPLSVVNFKGLETTPTKQNTRYLLAFDLDGTFLECNKTDIEKFNNISKQKNIKLAYISGRLGNELESIREEYAKKGIDIPMPDYFASSNGQYIYENINNKMVISEEWNDLITKSGFNRDNIKPVMANFIKENPIDSKPGMIQFDYRPSQFNIEYLISDKIRPVIDKKLSTYLKDNNIKGKIILDYIPPTTMAEHFKKLPEDFKNVLRPMLDKSGGLYAMHISAANKADAVEFIRNKINIDKNHVVTAGNSGNDISLALKGYWFIAVNNAEIILKNLIKSLAPAMKKHIIQATKDGTAGINEALEKIFAKVGLLKS